MYIDGYRNQRNHCKARGVEFNFSYEEWITFWGKDIDKRGRGLDKLQMCRNNDIGPYSIGNIYKATHQQNSSDKFTFGFKARKPAIVGELMITVKGMLDSGLSTRAVAYLVNCSQKQVMNFKNNLGAYALN